MTTQSSIEEIKEWIDLLIGREVVIEVNKGRKRTVTRRGTVEKAYPFFFTLRMDVDGSCQRISFNYVDILTKTIEVEVL